ncbi:MAG: cupredoxin domain-containing protein, partial [Candidatus Limnocylindrales bacterium]
MRRRRTAVGLGFGLAIAVLAGIAANAVARSNEPLEIPITIHYSHFTPALVSVPVGRPVTFVIENTDPIDHEWIVADAALHARHR